MKRLNFLVEGHTEEQFAWTVLAPHLAEFEVVIAVQMLVTGRKRVYQTYGQRQTKEFKGGIKSYQQVISDLQDWYLDDQNAVYTTMFDLYALPSDFPNYQQSLSLAPYTRIEQLEQAFARNVHFSGFIPYIQLHEFEALLFADVGVINDKIAVDAKRPEVSLRLLEQIRNSVENPELINDSPITAPSKRLETVFQSVYEKQYEKPSDAIRIAKEIGLEKIRAECPHFNAWVTKLENI
jgi:hypothetical protein